MIVIAPTRAACETIELAFGLSISTVLEREHGQEIRALAQSGDGFGIVAGTGTGKTLAIRPVAEEVLRAPLHVGVVNREREATPETPKCNVIIVTTGIARRWFQDGDILARDTLVVDEIHQTSAELELCLALGKRVGCRFIWLSATVDPRFYRDYLKAAAVLQSSAFDPARAASVKVIRKQPLDFMDERFLRSMHKERRGVGVFLPTRAQVEEVAVHVTTLYPRINAAHYHGGEPIRVIRPYLEEGVARPFVLSMTAAGQSALNVKGLDTVVIQDVRFTNLIEGGRNVLTRLHLGANELLQMAGRVHGRVENGRVFILSDRDISFDSLRPTAPEFQLAGDSERVAMTCADLGVRADELDLPVPLDRVAYRAALELLERRGIIAEGRLTQYGKAVEALPVNRPWAELLVNAEDDLLPFLAVMSSIESLHRMTRSERDLRGALVAGSDHLTAYNLYAEAYREAGYMGEVYGLPRHLFREEDLERWAERRGALMKSIEDAALACASVYRSLGVPLPTEMPWASGEFRRKFTELLVRFMPFDLVINEETAAGVEVRTGRDSLAGSWGAVAGDIRYFAGRDGSTRAVIEGTQIPMELIRSHAVAGNAQAIHRPEDREAPLVLERVRSYHGFELDRESEVIAEFPPEHVGMIRRALAESLARSQSHHPGTRRHRAEVDTVREVYRRSGGTTRRLSLEELAEHYASQMEMVNSLDDFMGASFRLVASDFVTTDDIKRYMALPSRVEVRGREVPIDYDVEMIDGESRPVARLRLPAKIARGLMADELPVLDRPLRFMVTRGQRGAVRAATLEELEENLTRPWSDDELRSSGRGTNRRDGGGRTRARMAQRGKSARSGDGQRGDKPRGPRSAGRGKNRGTRPGR